MIVRRQKQPAVPGGPALVAPPALSPEIERAAQVEAQLADARRDHVAAQAEVDAARAAYEAAADGARVSEAVAARARIAEAETVADIAGRKVARLDAELQPLLAGAADAAAAAEREQLRATAVQLQDEYRRQFGVRMPAITSELRGLIRLWAEAEIAREAAAAAGVRLWWADQFRDVEGTPRVEISRVVRDLWINGFGGLPYSDADQELIRIDPATGEGRLPGNNYMHRTSRRRRYDEIAFRPAVPGQLAPALFETLVLPCVTAGGPAGWSPLKGDTRPRAVLAALDALEAREAAPRSEPEVRTELVPIEPARDVRASRATPDHERDRERDGPRFAHTPDQEETRETSFSQRVSQHG